MNIDAFLHRVHGVVAALRGLAGKIGDLLTRQVYGPLRDIEERDSLYDEDLASERLWVGAAGAGVFASGWVGGCWAGLLALGGWVGAGASVL